MTTFIIIIGIIIVFILLLGFGARLQEQENLLLNERTQKIETALSSVPNFKATTKILGYKSLYAFAIDDDQKKVFYTTDQEEQYVLSYEDIISVELLEDNQVLSEKSSMRTIGGAVVGGVLAGGAGAIVGGLSGNTKQKQLHSSVVVKLLVRNVTMPTLTISCFDCQTMTLAKKPIKDGDSEMEIYKTGLAHAKQIVDLLHVIIDFVDKKQGAILPNQSTALSIAEELSKLALLKEQGILTEEEFNQQKTRLLQLQLLDK